MFFRYILFLGVDTLSKQSFYSLFETDLKLTPYTQLLSVERKHTVYCKYLVLQKVLAFTFCEESVMTVRIVTRCPGDLSSWKNAAKSMKCESIKQNCQQNLTSKGNHRFQYHCVINVWINSTFEVCAPNRTILGTLCIQLKWT